MASKRHLRRKACEGKQRYDDEEKAKAEAAGMSRSSLVKWNAYPCPHNGGNHWHIGHMTREEKKHDPEFINKHQLRQRR